LVEIWDRNGLGPVTPMQTDHDPSDIYKFGDKVTWGKGLYGTVIFPCDDLIGILTDDGEAKVAKAEEIEHIRTH
jgi:preprotein translocase subunit YajC